MLGQYEPSGAIHGIQIVRQTVSIRSVQRCKPPPPLPRGLWHGCSLSIRDYHHPCTHAGARTKTKEMRNSRHVRPGWLWRMPFLCISCWLLLQAWLLHAHAGLQAVRGTPTSAAVPSVPVDLVLSSNIITGAAAPHTQLARKVAFALRGTQVEDEYAAEIPGLPRRIARSQVSK